MQHATAENCRETRIRAFVGRHQNGLWRWLRTLGCEAARAEEHCQDALLAALHDNIDALADDEASRWLRTAAKNLFLMQLRAERRRPRTVDVEDLERSFVELGGERDGGDAALTALNRCLLSLPARDRDLVERRYRDRQSRDDMAAALSVSAAAIKQALRRVRDRLRQCVLRRLAADPEEL